jgi:hypothetical protein
MSYFFGAQNVLDLPPEEKNIYQEQLKLGLRNCRYSGPLSLTNIPCSFKLFESVVDVVHMR